MGIFERVIGHFWKKAAPYHGLPSKVREAYVELEQLYKDKHFCVWPVLLPDSPCKLGVTTSWSPGQDAVVVDAEVKAVNDAAFYVSNKRGLEAIVEKKMQECGTLVVYIGLKEKAPLSWNDK
ncbi:hypothetical protein HY642_04075 [Candidatus Woesearchaeota archaeon]|nr:hypothetical protein [Candidatus Woesearchaeota archaeon]